MYLIEAYVITKLQLIVKWLLACSFFYPECRNSPLVLQKPVKHIWYSEAKSPIIK